MANVQRKRTSRSVGLGRKNIRTVKKASTKRVVKKVAIKRPVKKAVKVTARKSIKKVTNSSNQKLLKAYRKTIQDLKTAQKNIESNFKLYGDYISKINEPINFIHGMDAKFQKHFSVSANRPSAKGKSPYVHGKASRSYLTTEMEKWPAKYKTWQLKSKRYKVEAKLQLNKAQQYLKLANKQLTQMKKAAEKPSAMFFRFEGQIKILGEMNKCYEKHFKNGFC